MTARVALLLVVISGCVPAITEPPSPPPRVVQEDDRECEFWALTPSAERWAFLEFTNPALARQLRQAKATWTWKVFWNHRVQTSVTERPVLFFAPERGGMHRVMWSVQVAPGAPLMAETYSRYLPCHSHKREVL